MSKTYCIVPKKRQMFQELVHGMQLTQEETALLAPCTILHVEIDPAKNGWEIVLQTMELLQEELLSRIAKFIQEHCGLAYVELYQQVVDMAGGIQSAWKELLHRTAQGDPSLLAIFENMRYRINGDTLVHEVSGLCSSELVRSQNVASRFAENIKGLLGFYCPVECETVEEATVDGENGQQAEVVSRTGETETVANLAAISKENERAREKALGKAKAIREA